MTTFSPILAEITWPIVLLAIAFVFVCLFMMFIILIQKPKGGGLSGAFGGAGGGESSFVGAKVGDVLTLITALCFFVFLGLAMVLTWQINPKANQAKAAAAANTATTTTAPVDGEAADNTEAESLIEDAEAVIEEAAEGVVSKIENAAETLGVEPVDVPASE